MVERPVAGLRYPAATGEFLTWFSTDADCLDYLEWLRWPSGFVCPQCGQGGWRLSDGRFECSGCKRRTSVTAGTIFDRTRTPLTVWFTACWQFAAAKDGISALSLQRSLEIGSYQTAWAMLHRLRSVLVRPGRERLTGVVEIDETYIGGEEPGLRGGRAKGKKLLVGIAVARPTPCADSSPITSRRAPPSSPTAGSPTARPPPDATSTSGSPAPAGRRPRRCRACTGSPRWPSGGCSAPTRAPRTTPTCPTTSTSSSSASTAAARAAAGWSSTAFSSSPSRTSRCATATSCSTRGPPRAHDSHPAHAASRRRWTARRPGDHDGKYLLRCSDPAMSAEDIALGYKQLITVERGWRDLKTHLELRPVYHRLEPRIRAHVLLCWLALLLVRIIETRTGRTWATVREDLQDLHVGVFTGPAGTFTQTSQPTPATRAVLAAIDVPLPKKILRLDPAT